MFDEGARVENQFNPLRRGQCKMVLAARTNLEVPGHIGRQQRLTAPGAFGKHPRRNASLGRQGVLTHVLTGVLGLSLEAPPVRSGLSDADIEALVRQRKEARDDKRWGNADAVRDQLAEAGISIADSAGGTTWSRD